MLELKINSAEMWDEKNEIFIEVPSVILRLEHSLISLSKWESKWKKPFLKTFSDINTVKQDEWLDYLKCMTITSNVSPTVYAALTQKQVREVFTYINDPMTATWFSKETKKQTKRGKEVTAEIIYFKMTYFGIPFECEKWHLNRLMTLIRVCEEMSAPPKTMGKREGAISNTQLNAARRRKLGSRG